MVIHGKKFTKQEIFNERVKYYRGVTGREPSMVLMQYWRKLIMEGKDPFEFFK